MIPLLSRTAITPRIIETIVVTDQLHTPSHYASEWRSQSVATCCERVVESSRAFQSGRSSFAVDSRVQVVNTPSRCKEEERGEELEKERETRKEERERERRGTKETERTKKKQSRGLATRNRFYRATVTRDFSSRCSRLRRNRSRDDNGRTYVRVTRAFNARGIDLSRGACTRTYVRATSAIYFDESLRLVMLSVASRFSNTHTRILLKLKRVPSDVIAQLNTYSTRFKL